MTSPYIRGLKAAKEYLGVESEKWITRRMDRIPHLRDGPRGTIFFRTADLDAFMNSLLVKVKRPPSPPPPGPSLVRSIMGERAPRRRKGAKA